MCVIYVYTICVYTLCMCVYVVCVCFMCTVNVWHVCIVCILYVDMCVHCVWYFSSFFLVALCCRFQVFYENIVLTFFFFSLSQLIILS